MLLSGIVQKTLQGNPKGTARLKGPTAASVCEEMEELEKTVVDCINRLKEDLTKGEAVVANEYDQAEQLIESLRADVRVLEAKIREAQDTIDKKDAASQKMEQTFAAKIVDLLNEMKKKDVSLESQGNEIKDLKSKLDVQAKQVSQLAHALKQAKAETAGETKRAEQMAANSTATITALEGQMKEACEMVREKDSTITALEQSHIAKIQDLENQIRTKEKDLADRDKEVNDLRSEVTTLMKRIKEMSSFFKQAEALANLADVQPQIIGTVDPGKRAETKPAACQPVGLTVTSNTTDASREETVPWSFFHSMIRELSEAFGPMASVILRDHVKAMGESMEKFPKTRVAELINDVSKEIANENIRITVRQHLDRLPIIKEPLPSDRRSSRPNVLRFP
jgi:myosin heavy subunit